MLLILSAVFSVEYSMKEGQGDDAFYVSLSNAIINRQPDLLLPLQNEDEEWVDKDRRLAFGQWSPGQSILIAVSRRIISLVNDSVDARKVLFLAAPWGTFFLWYVLTDHRKNAATLGIWLIAMPCTVNGLYTETLAMPCVVVVFFVWIRSIQQQPLRTVDLLSAVFCCGMLLVLRSYAAAIAWPVLWLILANSFREKRPWLFVVTLGIIVASMFPMFGWNWLMTGSWLQNPYFYKVGEFRAFDPQMPNAFLVTLHPAEGVFIRYPALVIGLIGLVWHTRMVWREHGWQVGVSSLTMLVAIVVQWYVMTCYFYLTKGRFLFAAAIPLAFFAVYLSKLHRGWLVGLLLCIIWSVCYRDIEYLTDWSSMLTAMMHRFGLIFVAADGLIALVVTFLAGVICYRRKPDDCVLLLAFVYSTCLVICRTQILWAFYGSLILLLGSAWFLNQKVSWTEIDCWKYFRWFVMPVSAMILLAGIAEFSAYYQVAYPAYRDCTRQDVSYHPCFLYGHKRQLISVGNQVDRVRVVEDALGLEHEEIVDPSIGIPTWLESRQGYAARGGIVDF